MPKSQHVSYDKMFESRKITFAEIPVCQYKKTIKEEMKEGNYTKEDLLGIYADMLAIREFEEMLQTIKKEANYNGKNFTYPGPSHLAIGEEATAVGQAYCLDENDFIFGTHRSHHEVIAKGLSAIKKLSDKKLTEIMKGVQGGRIYDLIKSKSTAKTTKALAKDFFLYGLMAELFAKDNGFSRGLGGSMHAFFLPFGIFPNNAIVGGSAPVGTGVALFKKVNKKKGIVVANAGDGAAARGPVYESMNFANMDQLRQLWDKDHNGGLPIIFNFNNNSYGMGGQTRGETMAYGDLARLGAMAENGMNAERVDGWNPLALIDCYKRKKALLAKGKGPVLLDVVTYRLSGHSTSDVMTYRTKEELEEWKEYDPIVKFPESLLKAKVATEAELQAVRDEVAARNRAMFELASDLEISPYTDYEANPNFLEDLMFSNEKVEKMEDRACDVLIPNKADNPQLQKIALKARFGLDANGKPYSKAKAYNIRDGIFEAILDKYYVDPTLIAYGEDVRDWNGAFSVYRGLTEAIPYHRLFNSPIAESAIVGTAVGYGMAGGRAIVELMYADFIGCAGDEIFNQLAKWQAMSADGLKMPVVLRVSVGSKYGAQHSQDWTALCAHIPGLKVVFPVTPYDAKGLMTSALNGTDPVVFFESQRIYDMGELFHKEGVPEGNYEIEIGEPDIKKEGKDITILTIGATLYRAIDAAKELEEKYGISAEIIDARSVVPFNYEKVIESVKKTGKILLTSDAVGRGSILNDMARNITELAFDYLDAPPAIVASENWITPAFEYDAQFFPQPSWILDAINEKLIPLAGHVSTKNYTPNEQLRKAKKGV
ncbi:MAG: dehydrogenase [Ruminococcaceae bacterium]|nr:dehydrogenase [Oscillospiraceae bacterium]